MAVWVPLLDIELYRGRAVLSIRLQSSFVVSGDVAPRDHQRNSESASMKLEMLGTMEIPYRQFEALLILTVNSKRIEARRIAAEYLFPH